VFDARNQSEILDRERFGQSHWSIGRIVQIQLIRFLSKFQSNF